jgi:hypothetical protein
MRRRVLAAGAALTAVGYVAVQRLGRSFGSTRAERRRLLPGDELCPEPQIVTTHATTIHAPPSHVWPWLLQLGWGRGQWYIARWVDRLLFPANGPSADTLRPELQQLAVGDRILDGPPEAHCAFVVERLDPAQHLVLHSTEHLPPGWAERFRAGIDFSWAFSRTRRRRPHPIRLPHPGPTAAVAGRGPVPGARRACRLRHVPPDAARGPGPRRGDHRRRPPPTRRWSRAAGRHRDDLEVT